MTRRRRGVLRLPPARGRGRGTLRRQIVLLAASVSLLASVLLVLLVQLILAGSSTRSADEALDVRADAVTGSIRAAGRTGRLVVPASVLDVGVAVYDAQGRLLAGRPPVRLATTYAGLPDDAARTVTADRREFRVLARNVTARDGTRGRVVLAERLAPYEQAERWALLVSVAAGVVLVLGATAVASWASYQVLRPVATMARTAEEWSEHDLGRRFDLGPPTDEIRALAGTLDGLLGKVAHAIRAEQRLTGELAHELRTPLSVVVSGAELLAARDDLDDTMREDVADIRAAGRRMADTVTSLIELARSGGAIGPDLPASVPAILRDAVDHLAEQHRRKVEVGAVPATAVVRFPQPLAVRALLPVLENAVRVGEAVRVTAERGATTWRVHVDDDGPGVAPSVRDTAFEPGFTTGDGAGLGLPLARRIARAGGGDVVLGDPSPGWSTRFTLVLPAA